MSYEIEKRFREFDQKEIEKRLKDLEFTKKGTYLFKIVTFFGIRPNQLIRIRDEGYRITLVVKDKKQRGNKNSYDKEWEIEINDFNKAVDILLEIGMRKRNIVEKIREIYIAPSEYGKSELIFDHYPGLPPYIEIEADSEEHLKKLIEDIGLNGSEDQSFGPAQLYREIYNYNNRNKRNKKNGKEGTNGLTFREMMRKNKEVNIGKNVNKFRKVVNQQRKMIENISSINQNKK
jgi:adenylate cyclase class 2